MNNKKIEDEISRVFFFIIRKKGNNIPMYKEKLSERHGHKILKL